MPTRGDLARAALGIIFCTAVVTTFFGWWLIDSALKGFREIAV
jgi:hypothetical protein